MDLKLYREVPRDVERISSRHQHPKITQTPTIKRLGFSQTSSHGWIFVLVMNLPKTLGRYDHQRS
jgi:hypothetical protein